MISNEFIMPNELSRPISTRQSNMQQMYLDKDFLIDQLNNENNNNDQIIEQKEQNNNNNINPVPTQYGTIPAHLLPAPHDSEPPKITQNINNKKFTNSFEITTKMNYK